MKVSQQAASSALRSVKPRLAGRLLLLALGLGTGPVLAQQQPVLPPALPAATDTVRRVVELPPAEVDSLAAAPLAPAPVDSVRLLWLQAAPTQFELVADRMACIESDMPLHFNEAVLAYVKLFTERQRGYTQRVLEREQFYFPTFEKYLTQYNLPTDLKYLSVVESALIPTAKSPVGAVGLWQFMPPTASDLRLKHDEWVDERMHPEKATEAACKHLRYLYGVFHDWELVLAAYNWGAGNVHRVMRRTGKKTFWELYPHLPAETRNYVPTFTAVLYALKYAPDYHLHDAALRYQRWEALDTLGLNGQALDLRRLSRALGYQDSTAMSRYNPEVRRGELPAGYRPYVLRYPTAARPQLAGIDRATLLSYCQPQAELPRPLAPRPVYLTGAAPPAALLAAAPAEGGAVRYRRVYYTVRRGQSLAEVAERFDVTPAQLRRWNGLSKSTAVRPGRELVVLRRVATPAPAEPVVAATTPAAAPLPRLIAPADSMAQALAAANARYAREAQARADHEAEERRQLLRLQQQQAARVVAQQRAAALRMATLARAAAAEEKARRLALAARPAASQPDEAPLPPGDADSSAVALRPRPGARPALAASSLPTPEETARPTRRPLALGLAAEPEAAPRGKTARPAITELEALPALAKTRPARPDAERPAFYTVQAGDNLTHIARAHDLSVAQLREWNQLPAEGGVQAGQRLRLRETAAPPADQTRVAAHAAALPLPLRLSTHTVQHGDTLFNLSQRFKVSVQELRRLNHLQSDEVKLGQRLVVPTAG